ncbi:MAG: 4Fe-4S binding protein [Eubacteriaceae bacterium]
MKKFIIDNDKCTGCNICRTACSTTYFKDDMPELARLSIFKDENDKNKIITCSQCNICIDICPVNALYKDKDDVVMLNKELCVNCLMCVGFCPSGMMRYSQKSATPFKCVLCGICAKNCPTGAIVIK